MPEMVTDAIRRPTLQAPLSGNRDSPRGTRAKLQEARAPLMASEPFRSVPTGGQALQIDLGREATVWSQFLVGINNSIAPVSSVKVIYTLGTEN